MFLIFLILLRICTTVFCFLFTFCILYLWMTILIYLKISAWLLQTFDVSFKMMLSLFYMYILAEGKSVSFFFQANQRVKCTKTKQLLLWFITRFWVRDYFCFASIFIYWQLIFVNFFVCLYTDFVFFAKDYILNDIYYKFILFCLFC